MRTFYEANLALIHNAGFGALARGAGRVVLKTMRAKAPADASLLDLGCGSGELAEQVSIAGYAVTGIDLSPHLLRIARSRAPQARFVLGSIYEADLPPAYAVTMIGECVNYVVDGRPTPDDLAALFARVHAALAPGGFFLFDAAGPGRVPGGRAQVFSHHPEWTVLMESREEGATLRREITTFRRAGDLYRREDETHVLHLWAPDVIATALAAAGFEVSQFEAYDDVALPPGLHGYRALKPA